MRMKMELKIRTSQEIKASISFNKGFEHLNENPKEEWVSIKSLHDYVMKRFHNDGLTEKAILDEIMKKIV